MDGSPLANFFLGLASGALFHSGAVAMTNSTPQKHPSSR